MLLNHHPNVTVQTPNETCDLSSGATFTKGYMALLKIAEQNIHRMITG